MANFNRPSDPLNCTIKRKAGTYNSYTLNFKGLTRGMILATCFALIERSPDSAVAGDVLSFMKNAIKQSTDEELKKLLVDMATAE